jgi:hypothetical protein
MMLDSGLERFKETRTTQCSRNCMKPVKASSDRGARTSGLRDGGRPLRDHCRRRVDHVDGGMGLADRRRRQNLRNLKEAPGRLPRSYPKGCRVVGSSTIWHEMPTMVRRYVRPWHERERLCHSRAEGSRERWEPKPGSGIGRRVGRGPDLAAICQLTSSPCRA